MEVQVGRGCLAPRAWDVKGRQPALMSTRMSRRDLAKHHRVNKVGLTFCDVLVWHVVQN